MLILLAPKYMNEAKKIEKSIIAGISKRNTSRDTDIGDIKEVSPSTAAILKILLPMILPMAIPGILFFAAIRDVTSSGREVPIAIIVIPMSTSDIPAHLAITTEESTTNLPPTTTAPAPANAKNRIEDRDRTF